MKSTDCAADRSKARWNSNGFGAQVARGSNTTMDLQNSNSYRVINPNPNHSSELFRLLQRSKSNTVEKSKNGTTGYVSDMAPTKGFPPIKSSSNPSESGSFGCSDSVPQGSRFNREFRLARTAGTGANNGFDPALKEINSANEYGSTLHGSSLSSESGSNVQGKKSVNGHDSSQVILSSPQCGDSFPESHLPDSSMDWYQRVELQPMLNDSGAQRAFINGGKVDDSPGSYENEHTHTEDQLHDLNLREGSDGLRDSVDSNRSQLEQDCSYELFCNMSELDMFDFDSAVYQYQGQIGKSELQQNYLDPYVSEIWRKLFVVEGFFRCCERRSLIRRLAGGYRFVRPFDECRCFKYDAD